MVCAGGLLVAMLGGSSVVDASPGVGLEDPVVEELSRLRAGGRLPPYTGGLRPLSERRVQELLRAAGEAIDRLARLEGLWVHPLERAWLHVSAIREQARPYSTPLRPRDLAGVVALSCEHQQGRPCGDGIALVTELDSSIGYGPWVSGSIRLQASAGSEGYDEDIAVDRAYVHAEVGPAALEVGRDVLVLGPSARTQVAWGDHAPPLDHVRLSTARPFDLAGEGGSTLRGNLVYVLGRLRAPQTYPGNLVSIGRWQLDIANDVEVGMMQMLQLAGEGAPSIGLWDFIAEHFRRRDLSAGPSDSSNRRISFDVAVRVARLAGARLYYEVAFEDMRVKYFHHAVRRDADHLVGVELAAIGAGGRHGLVVELQKTGVRSQEHTPRVTGFTSARRVVGSPLGPDALALYGGGRIELGWASLAPWAEIARLSSSTYMFVVDGPIRQVSEGADEHRYRAGGRLRLPLPHGLRVETEAMFEHVTTAGFEAGARQDNVGVMATVVWQPGGALGYSRLRGW